MRYGDHLFCNYPLLTTRHPLSPVFSHSCALFCTKKNLISILIKHFHTLCPKHPGVGGPLAESWFFLSVLSVPPWQTLFHGPQDTGHRPRFAAAHFASESQLSLR